MATLIAAKSKTQVSETIQIQEFTYNEISGNRASRVTQEISEELAPYPHPSGIKKSESKSENTGVKNMQPPTHSQMLAEDPPIFKNVQVLKSQSAALRRKIKKVEGGIGKHHSELAKLYSSKAICSSKSKRGELQSKIDSQKVALEQQEKALTVSILVSLLALTSNLCKHFRELRKNWQM